MIKKLKKLNIIQSLVFKSENCPNTMEYKFFNILKERSGGQFLIDFAKPIEKQST